MNNTRLALAIGALIFTGAAMSASDTVGVTGTVQEVLTIAVAGGTPSFNITPNTDVNNMDLGTITINSTGCCCNQKS